MQNKTKMKKINTSYQIDEFKKHEALEKEKQLNRATKLSLVQEPCIWTSNDTQLIFLKIKKVT